MYDEISYEETRDVQNKIYVDVRSPKEFKKEHIPGAINIPILDDKTREIVGTLYKQGEIDQAKKEAINHVSKKLPEMFDQYINLSHEYAKVFLYCSRGGYRSSAVSALLFSLDLNIYKIHGGYKFYRKYVRENMSELIKSIHPIVLYGKTGSAKTMLLLELKRRGYPVIDLEALANHRGSILGGVGLGEQVTQKQFDSLLFEELDKVKNKLVFLEGESQRIGKVYMPKELYDQFEVGKVVKIQTPIEKRVELLVREYASASDDEIHKSIDRFNKYLFKAKLQELHEYIEKKEYEEFARVMCLEYYDRVYRERFEEFDAVLENVSFDRTCKELEEIYEKAST